MNALALLPLLIFPTIQGADGLVRLQPFPTSTMKAAATTITSALLAARNTTHTPLPTADAEKGTGNTTANSTIAKAAPVIFFIGVVAFIGICVTSYYLGEKFVEKRKRNRGLEEDEIELLQGITSIDRTREEEFIRADREYIARMLDGASDGLVDEEAAGEGARGAA